MLITFFHQLTKDGVLFADGVELKVRGCRDAALRRLADRNSQADIVVCATGYSSMRETVRRVVSDDVANRIGECWGQDQQGEIVSPFSLPLLSNAR